MYFELLPISLKMPGGMSSSGWWWEWPASSSSTLRPPSVTRRAAATQPEAPPPMTMWSYSSVMRGFQDFVFQRTWVRRNC